VKSKRNSVQKSENDRNINEHIKRLITAEEGVKRACNNYKIKKGKETEEQALANRTDYQNQLMNYYQNSYVDASNKIQVQIKKTSPILILQKNINNFGPNRKIYTAFNSSKVRSLAHSPNNYTSHAISVKIPSSKAVKNTDFYSNFINNDQNNAVKRHIILLRKKSQHKHNLSETVIKNQQNFENSDKNAETPIPIFNFPNKPSEITLNFRIFTPNSGICNNLLLKGNCMKMEKIKKANFHPSKIHRKNQSEIISRKLLSDFK